MFRKVSRTAKASLLRKTSPGRGKMAKPERGAGGIASAMTEGVYCTAMHFAIERETFPPCQGPHPRGGWHRAAMTGGVPKQKSLPRREGFESLFTDAAALLQC